MLCSLHPVDKPTRVTDTSRSLLDVIMVYLNGDIGDWFRTTVGVRQGCLRSPTLFNIFLERIATDALEDHKGTVSIGGRTIINLRFAGRKRGGTSLPRGSPG